MSMISRMQSCLVLEKGMRLYYDCPAMSMEDVDSDAFFKKYRGRTATIIDFGTVIVPPLDSKGRRPGKYYDSNRVMVRFGEEEQIHSLPLRHFVLMSETKSTASGGSLENQYVGDLTHPVEFYPGDFVYKVEDLLQVQRMVIRIIIRNDESVVYELSETEDDRIAREQENEEKKEKARKEGNLFTAVSMTRISRAKTEICDANELHLVSAGNINHLYNDPDKLNFSSRKEELTFWSQDGISYTAAHKVHRRFGSGITDVPYKIAQEMFDAEEGDIILTHKKHEGVIVTGRTGDCMIRRLHPCFEKHREHVRAVSRKVKAPIVEPEKDMESLMRGLVLA